MGYEAEAASEHYLDITTDPALHKKCPLAMLFRGKMGLSGLEKPSK
jgi:hypothetical protein